MHRRRHLLALLLAVACLPVALPAAASGATAASRESAASPRIVGGQDADIANWPFLAAIVRSDVEDGFQAQFCGGSLVAPRVVLTAAHCIDGHDVDVLFGRTQLTASGGERIPVTAQVRAPGYDAETNRPDLALLLLERPASVPPVAMASATPGAGAGVEVAGWGLVSQTPREISADILQQAPLTVFPSRRCASAYGTFAFAGAEMICAGTPDAGRPDSCNGDSGGPLVTRGPAAVELVGVVSFGSKVCGDPEAPAVYASVAANRAWLDAEIARLDRGQVPTQPVEPAADTRSIRLRFGRMSCPSNLCFVDIRTTGPVEALTGGLVLWVHRKGRAPIDRFALAERVRDGRWRAWVNLPFGRLRLIAVGVDEDANPVTRLARTTIRVTPG